MHKCFMYIISQYNYIMVNMGLLQKTAKEIQSKYTVSKYYW